MDLLETLTSVADRLQISMLVGDVPTDRSGDIRVLHANSAAASLFGYASGKELVGVDVRTLMPDSIGRQHRGFVSSYMDAPSIRPSGIMGAWRQLQIVTRGGALLDVQINVAHIRNSSQQYFVAVLRDCSKDLERERQLSEALARSEKLAKEAEAARLLTEDILAKERRLTAQISVLRLIFKGTVGLVFMLAVLIVVQWMTRASGTEGIGMVKDILLVLTGILGSAMASVFDARSKKDLP